MPKILNILETAYRATLEEQDDTVLWLSQMLKNAGADISLLLRANAVNYALSGQDASGLSFGKVTLAHPPEIDKDVLKLMEKESQSIMVEEDARERGIPDEQLIPGIKKGSRARLPELLDQHDQIWHW
jgi:hypothetical protein